MRADSSGSAGGRGGASSGGGGGIISVVEEFEMAKKTPGVQNATRRILEWLQQVLIPIFSRKCVMRQKFWHGQGYPRFHLKFYAIFSSLNVDPALT